jgi:hypothetical protein
VAHCITLGLFASYTRLLGETSDAVEKHSYVCEIGGRSLWSGPSKLYGVNMMRKMLVTGVATALLMAASGAQALTLIGGEGWEYGQDNAKNTAQVTPITLDVTNPDGDTFSLTDGFQPGDVYKVSFKEGLITFGAMSVFTSYPTTFNNNTGPYASTFAPDWLNNDFSHLQVLLSPGTYTVTVKDTSNVGYPAGFGFRLDAGVPEPATWAMMVFGLGLLGAGLRLARGKDETALTAA